MKFLIFLTCVKSCIATSEILSCIGRNWCCALYTSTFLTRTLYISKLEFNIANHVCWLEPGAILYTYICICICKYLLQFVSALKTLFIFIPTYIHAYMHVYMYLSICLVPPPKKKHGFYISAGIYSVCLLFFPYIFLASFFLSFLVAFEVPRICN